MDTATYGTCACGCGEAITHEGSSYAGASEADRNRHRAKASYRRKTGAAGDRPAGTRESLAALGLADDVPIADLANRVAAAMGELARRTAGIDSTEIERRIEQGLAEARQHVEAAEAAQARATERARVAADEATAAAARADRADDDAAAAGDRAEALAGRVQEMTAAIARADRELADAQHRAEVADRRAERAEAVTAEIRANRDQAIEEVRRAADSARLVALAELRAELTTVIGDLRTEVATVTAQREAAEQRAVRAETEVETAARRYEQRITALDEEIRRVRSRAEDAERMQADLTKTPSATSTRPSANTNRRPPKPQI